MKTLELYSVLYQLSLQVFASNTTDGYYQTRHLYYLLSSRASYGRPECVGEETERVDTHTYTTHMITNQMAVLTFRRSNASHTLF